MRCERCLELQIDEWDGMAEVIDVTGERLVIHATCMVESDQQA